MFTLEKSGLRTSLLKTTALCVCVGFAAPAWAANTGDAVKLDDVVISANRVATPIDRVGSSVTVITAKDIEESQATSALDMLEEVPGLTVNYNGGRGTASYLYMRGSDYTGILIMVDGMAVHDPSKPGATYDLTHISADDIERIEVLRGNQSTLYGSQAVGGVISITTKSGKNSAKLLEGNVGFEYGSFNSLKATTNLMGRYDKVYYGLSANRFSTDGFDISKVDNKTEDDGYVNTSYNLRLGADLLEDVGAVDKWNVEGQVRYMLADLDYDMSGPADNPNSQRKTERGGQFKTDLDLFDGLLANSFNVSYFQNQRDMYSNGTNRQTTNSFYDGVASQYNYKGTLRPADGHAFTFGVDHSIDDIKTDKQDRDISNTGYYGNYQVDLLDNLSLTFGMRLDDHEAFGAHTTYRTTAGYKLEETNTRFHTSFGTGFNAPSVYQLYAPDTVYNMGGGPIVYKLGNPDLDAETSTSFDFGIEQNLFDDRLVFDVTFYNSRIKDKISYGGSSVGYINIASSRAYGVEMSVDAEVTDEINLSWNHTYNEARDNTNGHSMSGQPKHEGGLNVRYAPDYVEGLSVYTKARYSTWRFDSYRNGYPYTGGFIVWDLGGRYNLTDDIVLNARIENLLDKQYYTKGQYEQGGIAGYVGVNFKF